MSNHKGQGGQRGRGRRGGGGVMARLSDSLALKPSQSAAVTIRLVNLYGSAATTASVCQ